ncbi:MAG: PDZ domain-containing protein, partial [Erysipelotrichaceae bacterium]|nr:PDZ domain-containing protein [Erysipelotrichaceae bacterium]
KGSFLKDMYNYEKTNLSIPIETVDGLYVERIKENGVAYAAGLRAGDVVTKINDEVIIGLDSYLRAIYSDNTQLNIEYVRGGQTLVGSLGND